jgi:pilus assembly protein CpaF
MLRLSIEAPNLAPSIVEVLDLPCQIGKSAKNTVCLSGWRVSKLHAEIRSSRVGIKLVDLGSIGGTWVNGERIAEYGPLDETDEILIAGYKIRLLSEASFSGGSAAAIDKSNSVAQLLSSRDSTDGKLDQVTQGDQREQPVLSQQQAFFHWQRTLQRRLFESVDFRRQDLNALSTAQLRLEVCELIDKLIAVTDDLPVDIDRVLLRDRLVDEAVGFGALEPLLADGSITEIMVNGPDEVFIERQGKLSKSSLKFSSTQALRSIIDRIVGPLGRRIDESSPMVDARLPDGSRVNVVIEPLAINGPVMTIRKFSKTVLSPQNLIDLGSATPDLISFLTLCVKERKNVVVSGGTGSGKTTLLNVLSNLIPDGERVLTIEDSAELRLRHSHCVSMEARPQNAEGKGLVSIRDLVRNALRMRPDRIIVGECRGAEAIDMLQAMNTGHDGSLTTVHANSPRDALRRLEAMVLMGGIDMPLQAIREQIVGGIDFVVQQTRSANGTRVISEVLEIVGMESQKIQTQSIFRYDFALKTMLACETIPQFLEDVMFASNAEHQAVLSLFANKTSNQSATHVRGASYAA